MTITAAEPPTEALRKHHARIDGMLRDPELKADLLLVGMVFARLVDFHPSSEWNIPRMVQWVYPCPPHMHGPVWLKKSTVKFVGVLRSDIRRYVAPPSDGRCSAPIRGRTGACGRPGSALGATLTDVATGEQEHMQACSRHVEWLRALSRENRDLRETAAVPVPIANSGGVLTRHLDELDWPAMWRKLDPTWVQAREPGEAMRRTVRLHKIDGDAEGGLAVVPSLSVIAGGRGA